MFTMIKLDDIDISILKALQNDGKANTKELCGLLGLTKTPVYERIRRLESEGAIRGYTAIIDNDKVGLPLTVFCNVSLVVHDDLHISQFKEDVMKIEEIMDCYSTGGVFDFLIRVVLKDMEEFNRFVFEKLTKVRGIAKMQSSFVLSEIKHSNVLNIRIL